MPATAPRYDHDEHGRVRVVERDEDRGVVYFGVVGEWLHGTDIPVTGRAAADEFEASTDPVDQTIGASTASIDTTDS